MRSLFLGPALVLASSLPAQPAFYQVSPKTFENLDASGQNAFPFSGNNKASYQQIHDDLAGRPKLIVGLAFRINGGVTCPARSMNLTLSFSTAAVTSQTASGTFAANHGPDLTTVLTQVAVQWPAVTAAPTPAPFDLALPFSPTPFLFKGQGSLCWEVRVHSNTQTAYVMHDAASTKAAPKLSAPFGRGCPATGAATPAALSASLAPAGPVFNYAVAATNLTASQPGFWFIGTNSSQWGLLDLPLDLGPLGAPGCSFYLAVLLAMAGMTDGQGALALSAPVPASPYLDGLPLYSQCAALDQGRPQLPLVFTNGHADAFPLASPIPYPSCRIYGMGSDTGAAGTYSLDYPLVTRFSYR